MDNQQQQQHGHYPAATRSVSPEPEPPLPISSYPSVTATFRSQRITSPSLASSAAGVPLMLRRPPAASFLDHKLPPTPTPTLTYRSLEEDTSHDAAVVAVGHKKEAIGSIPVLPKYHLLERTALRIPESSAMTLSVLLDRILDFLRLHSVRYQSQSNAGCLDCEATQPDGDMVGFVIQLWRDFDSSSSVRTIILEAQRREGCSIAMNAIRRSLMRHVTGEQDTPPQPQQQEQDPASLLGRRYHHQFSGCSTSNPTFHSATRDHHKRPRSLSPEKARIHCQDALSFSLRLLNSTRHDQNKLGLESLGVMTNPRLVDPIDAYVVSSALVLGQGPFGAPMQTSLAALLHAVHPKRGRGPMECHGNLFHLALHVLANALMVVEGNAISLDCSLWQIVMDCLLFGLDDATQRPHEAALSAKCIRRLLPATQRAVAAASQQQLQMQGMTNVAGLHATAQKALQYGKSHHKALEQEAGHLLGFLPSVA
jgi:hypothetical protein